MSWCCYPNCAAEVSGFQMVCVAHVNERKAQCAYRNPIRADQKPRNNPDCALPSHEFVLNCDTCRVHGGTTWDARFNCKPCDRCHFCDEVHVAKELIAA